MTLILTVIALNLMFWWGGVAWLALGIASLSLIGTLLMLAYVVKLGERQQGQWDDALANLKRNGENTP